MNRILLTRLVPLLMMVWLPLSMPAVNTIIYNATYDFGKMTTGTDTLGGVTYTTVNYDGMFNSGEPGMPSLPVDYIKLSVPYNATNFSVTATLQNSFIGNINHLMYPCQPSRMMNDTTPIVIIPPDASVYNSNSYYPSRNAWVVDEGFLAGENHIVTVAVMPVSYWHRALGSVTTNQLRESQTVRIVLSYDLNSSSQLTPIYCLSESVKNEGRIMTKSIVVNPNDVDQNAPTGLFMVATSPTFTGIDDYLAAIDTLDLYGEPEEFQMNLAPEYDYSIITSNALKPAFKRFVALKRQKGYATGVITMEEIMRNPLIPGGDIIIDSEGNLRMAYSDRAGVLRQYLKIMYGMKNGKYTLLVGPDIPNRYITLKPLADHDSITFASDMYYSDLNGDWSMKKIDKQPELNVGRIIAKNDYQILYYTDKLLRYELNPGNGDTDYLNWAFYSQSYDMRIRGEVDILKHVTDSLYSNSTVYSESNNYRDKSNFPTGTDIVNELNNNKYGFVSFHHHGYPSGLLTYGFRNVFNNDTVCWDKCRFLWAIDSVHTASAWFASQDHSINNGLNNLNNKLYPNICYSIACKTMPFDVLPGYETIPMNFGESYTTGKDYGGPIFIGNTNNGITPNSVFLERDFFKQVKNSHYKIGEANKLAKLTNQFNYDLQTDRYICTVQNLLGDPELEIWTTGSPHRFNGVTVVRNDTSITVSNVDVDSAIVAYSYMQSVPHQGNDTIQLGNSVIFKNISPNSTIMVFKHDCIPYIAPLLLQNTDISKSQYIIASDMAAGNSVDSNRTTGDVTIKSGATFEIEASGDVLLNGGVSVEKGASFGVYPSHF